jgi:hypothetical protein
VTNLAKIRRTRLRTILGLLLLPLAIGVQWLSSLVPEAVESLYSRTLFPPIVAALASFSSRVPFSLAEVGLACACAIVVWALIWTCRLLVRAKGLRWRVLGRAVVVGVSVAGAGYSLFLITWGLNNQRSTFGRSAGLDVRPSDRAELSTLSGSLIDEANRLRAALPEDEHGAMRLTDAPRRALARTALGVAALVNRYPWLPRSEVRPKAAWSSPLLAYLGIGGFYSPPTAEATVCADIPPSDVLFAAAHEAGHQLGFAREDEANYLGYLICRLHPDADFRYSGAFTASRHALRALAQVDRPEARGLEARRSEAVKRDMAALAAWVARYSGPAMRTFNRANDAYLRSQGQREGVRSYGRMVDLLLAAWRAERNTTTPRDER